VRDSRLTNGICDVVSDVDGDGSKDFSSDGSSSESSDCSSESDGGPRARFSDLPEFSEDDDDSDALSDSEMAASTSADGSGQKRSKMPRPVRHDAPSAAVYEFPFQHVSP
jgi:hypothetical protein